MRWQPIDTAPKDGTSILVWSPTPEQADVAWWADGPGCWLDNYGKYLTDEPSHWMHLPDGPR